DPTRSRLEARRLGGWRRRPDSRVRRTPSRDGSAPPTRIRSAKPSGRRPPDWRRGRGCAWGCRDRGRLSLRTSGAPLGNRTAETSFASSSGRRGKIAATSSCVVSWLSERPYIDDAAHPDGRQSRGELDDGLGVVAFDQVEGAQRFVRLGGWPLAPEDLLSGQANGRCLPCRSNAVVRYHIHGGVGCSLNVVVQRAMGAVEAAFFLRGEVVQ